MRVQHGNTMHGNFGAASLISVLIFSLSLSVFCRVHLSLFAAMYRRDTRLHVMLSADIAITSRTLNARAYLKCAAKKKMQICAERGKSLINYVDDYEHALRCGVTVRECRCVFCILQFNAWWETPRCCLFLIHSSSRYFILSMLPCFVRIFFCFCVLFFSAIIIICVWVVYDQRRINLWTLVDACWRAATNNKYYQFNGEHGILRRFDKPATERILFRLQRIFFRKIKITKTTNEQNRQSMLTAAPQVIRDILQ